LETIADFEVQYSQFLDPEGKPSSDIPELAKDKDALIGLYRAMTETLDDLIQRRDLFVSQSVQ